MKLFVHAPQILAIDVGVDLRRRDISMPEHLLHCAEISAALEQMRANECRSVCGLTCFSILAISTYFRRIFHAPIRESGWPRALRKSRPFPSPFSSRGRSSRRYIPTAPMADLPMEPAVLSILCRIPGSRRHRASDPGRPDQSIHSREAPLRTRARAWRGHGIRAAHRSKLQRATGPLLPRENFGQCPPLLGRFETLAWIVGICPSPIMNLKYVRVADTERLMLDGDKPISFK